MVLASFRRPKFGAVWVVLDYRLESIKDLTDEIDNFETKLRRLDMLIKTDGDLAEIEKVFVLMKECIHVTRNMSLMEEKTEKIEYYEDKLKEHLDTKIEAAIQDDDIDTIQSLLKLYSVMEKDLEFVDTLVQHKFLPEFQSLKQLKRLSLGPVHYYFDSLQGFVEKKVDTMMQIFGNKKCIKYLTIVLQKISEKFIDEISQSFTTLHEVSFILSNNYRSKSMMTKMLKSTIQRT